MRGAHSWNHVQCITGFSGLIVYVAHCLALPLPVRPVHIRPEDLVDDAFLHATSFGQDASADVPMETDTDCVCGACGGQHGSRDEAMSKDAAQGQAETMLGPIKALLELGFIATVDGSAAGPELVEKLIDTQCQVFRVIDGRCIYCMLVHRLIYGKLIWQEPLLSRARISQLFDCATYWSWFALVPESLMVVCIAARHLRHVSLTSSSFSQRFPGLPLSFGCFHLGFYFCSTLVIPDLSKIPSCDLVCNTWSGLLQPAPDGLQGRQSWTFVAVRSLIVLQELERVSACWVYSEVSHPRRL